MPINWLEASNIAPIAVGDAIPPIVKETNKDTALHCPLKLFDTQVIIAMINGVIDVKRKKSPRAMPTSKVKKLSIITPAIATTVAIKAT